MKDVDKGRGLWGAYRLSLDGAKLAWQLPNQPKYYCACKPDAGAHRRVEPVEVHDLVPGGDEVVDELLAAVLAPADHDLITIVGDDLVDAYVASVPAVRRRPEVAGVPVAYTAMHGVGGAIVVRAFEAAGLPDYYAWQHDLALALAEEQPVLGAVPSYATVRRFMKAQGWRRKRRPKHQTPGAQQAAARLERCEVRSFEAEYADGLWHLDFHHGSRPILTPAGQGRCLRPTPRS